MNRMRRPSVLAIVVLLLVFLLIIVLKPSPAYSAGPDGTGYRRSITINNTGNASTLTNYQTSVVIDTQTLISEGKLQIDCDDLRFRDTDDTTALNYWVESGCNTSTTRVWIRVPSIAGSANKTIYLYYGSPSASIGSNGSATFDFFDDFTTFNTGVWTATGATSVSSGRLNVTTGSVYSNATVNSQPNIITEARVSWSNYFAGHSGMNIASSQAMQFGNAGSGRLAYFMTTGGSGGQPIDAIYVSGANGSVADYNLVSGVAQFTSTADTNYILSSVVTSTQLRFYQNRTLLNSYSGTWSGSFYILLGNFQGSNAGTTNISDISVDWVLNRKYTATEPSLTVGGTESEVDQPTAPQNLAATSGNAQVSLDWDAPLDDGGFPVTDYVIEYRPVGGSFSVFNDGTSATTAGVVTGLTNTTTYEFRVAAITERGQSPYSNTASATPLNDTPVVPTATTVTIAGPISRNETVTGSYVFGDENGDTESGSTFRWLSSNSAGGPFSPITGATLIEYTIPPSLVGQYLRFEVTPRTSVAPTDGSAVQSASQLVGGLSSGIHHIVFTGQSLTRGYNGPPALSTTQPYNNIMLSGGAFVPLIENFDPPEDQLSGVVESPASAMGNLLTSLAGGSYRVLVTKNALSGSTYAQINQGTVTYNQGISDVTTAQGLADDASTSYRVTAVAAIHGGTDHDQGTTGATYKANMVEWQSDYQTDIKAITSQAGTIPLFIDQIANFTYYGDATSEIPYAQLDAWRENQGKIYLVGPKYFLTYYDGAHLINTEYRRLGEYYAKAISKVTVDGEPWVPLSPDEIFISGSTLTARFNVPAPPLVFDTTSILAKANYGFEYTDDSGSPPAISSVTLHNSTTVRVTLASTPSGANPRLRYAYTGTPGANPGGNQSGSARGNLRDSDATPSLYGNNLYNWSVHFNETTTSDTTPPASFTPTVNPGILTNDTTPAVSYSTTDANGIDYYQVQVDGGGFTTQVSPYTLPALTEGAHTITVRAFDVPGNYRDEQVTVTIDTTPPSTFTPTVAPPSPTSDTTPTVTFSTTDTNGIDHYEVQVDSGSFTTQSSPYTLPTLTEGAHTITVRAFDNAGNARDGQVTVTIDTSAPNAFTPTMAPPSPTNDTTPTVTFSTADTNGIDHYEVQVDSGSFTTQSSPYTLPTLTEGAHTITVRAFDTVGNTRDGQVSVTIDTTSPNTFTPTVAPPSPTNDNTPTVSFSTTDTNGIDHYEVQVDSGSFTTQSSPYTLPTLSDGSHTITVRAFDTAGNIRDGQVSVTIDTGSPVAFTPTVAPPSPTSDTTPTVTFSTTDTNGIDHYEVQVDSGSFTTQSSPYTLPTLTEGAHTITVRAFDTLGNTRDGQVTVIIDTSPPSTFTPQVSPASPTTSDAVTVTFSTTDTNGINYYLVRIDGGSFTQLTSPYDVGTLAQGSHTVDVRAYDNAGNYRDGSVTFSVGPVPTPTPTPTSTPTPTATPTSTPTATPTASPTSSPTATPTATVSASPTASPTVTGTATPTTAPTATVSPTISVTPTITASPEPSPSSTPIPADGITVLYENSIIKIGDTVTTRNQKPLLTGYAKAGSRITIAASSGSIGGTTVADKTGFWSWAPSTALSAGSYTITASSDQPASMQFTLVIQPTATPTPRPATPPAQTNWIVWIVGILGAATLFAIVVAVLRRKV